MRLFLRRNHMRLTLHAVIAACAVAALSATPAPAGTKKPKKDPGSRMLCKEFGEAGSRTRVVRVCRTKAEWDLEEMTIRQGMADQQRRDGGTGQTRDGPLLPGNGDPDGGAGPR